MSSRTCIKCGLGKREYYFTSNNVCLDCHDASHMNRLNSAEKANMLDEIAKAAKSAASAFRHGRFNTAMDKLDDVFDGILQVRLGRKIT